MNSPHQSVQPSSPPQQSDKAAATRHWRFHAPHPAPRPPIAAAHRDGPAPPR